MGKKLKKRTDVTRKKKRKKLHRLLHWLEQFMTLTSYFHETNRTHLNICNFLHKNEPKFKSCTIFLRSNNTCSICVSSTFGSKTSNTWISRGISYGVLTTCFICFVRLLWKRGRVWIKTERLFCHITYICCVSCVWL